SGSSPSLRAGAAVSGVEEEAAGYYLCDEGGRLSVYRCDAGGVPRQLLERTDIYTNLLPEADALRYKSGYYVWSLQELETLLEDLGARLPRAGGPRRLTAPRCWVRLTSTD